MNYLGTSISQLVSRVSPLASRISLLVVILASCFSHLAIAQSTEVDFRYRPFNWETVISEPADWLKTTVNQRAALTYDYGPGPYATAGTQVHLEMVEGSFTVGNVKWSQGIHGMVEYDLYTPGGQLVSAALYRWPNPTAQATMPDGFRRREGQFSHVLGWVKQPAEVDPAFTSVAWNPNRAIVYEVQVTPGSRKRIALGWADGRYNMPMHRVMDAIVEGAPTLEIAPVRDAGQGKPHVKFFDAHDADNDGWIRMTIAPSSNGTDPNSLLSGIWVFPAGTQVAEAEVIDGRARAKAEKMIDTGNDLHGHMPGRTDLLVAQSSEYQNMKVVVRTNRRLTWDNTSKQLALNGKTWLSTVPAATGIRVIEGGYEVTLPLTNKALVAVMHGNNPRIPTSFADADLAAEALASVWESHRKVFPFPFEVPDLDIQDVLQANWDNLHRMKDTVETWQQYHIGPSVYRGLWVVDATMLMQGAIVNGDTSGTRHMVEAVGRHQKPNGQVEVMVPHVMYRETASYIQQMVMYAEYSGDDQWLLNRWDRVRAGLNYLRELRETTMGDPSTIYYGLFPPGFTDGGLAGVNPEYSSVYYTLGALHSALRTVRRLDIDEPEIDVWRKFYVDLRTAFNKAAQRDMRKDEYGNWFLPMRIGETDPDVRPTTAQWAMLEAINYAEYFSKGDSLAEGTMAVLTQHTDQGLAVGTGWLADALWPWFSMIQGSAHVHMEQPEAVIGLLYDIANHATPLGTWVEEQQPRAVGQRTGGDHSNASGSALYLTMMRRMLVNERSGTLELLPAVPETWLGAGKKISIDRTLTHWGPLMLETEVSADGNTLTVRWDLELRDGRMAPKVVLRPEMIEKAGFRVSELVLNGRSGEIVFQK